jgi:uncharacterized protein
MNKKLLGYALLVIVAVLVTLPGALKTFPPDNSLKIWFLKSDPLLKGYGDFQAKFGNDEVIVMTLSLMSPLSEKGISKEEFHEFEKVANQIESIEGVEQIISVFSVVNAYQVDGELKFGSIFDRGFDERIHEYISDNKFFQDRLIDQELKTIVWLIKMQSMDDIDLKRDGIVAQVRKTVNSRLKQYLPAMGGIGIVYSALNIITQRDFGIFISISYLLIYLCLFLLFREIYVVIAIATALSCANIVVMGLYGYNGNQINMVSIAIPSLIFVLGLVGLIHFPNAIYLAQKEGGDSSSAVDRGIKKIFLPCLLTTVTTAIGFASFAPAPMPVMRDFGVYTAGGLLLAFFFGVVLLRFVYQSRKVQGNLISPQWIEKFLSRIEFLLERHVKLFLAFGVTILMVAGFFASKVQVDTYTLGYLPDDDVASLDHLQIEEKWGDYMPLEFLVKVESGVDLRGSEILNKQDEFIRIAKNKDLIRAGFSLSDIYRHILEVLKGETFEGEFTDTMIAQLNTIIDSQDLVWMGSKGKLQQNFMRHFVDEDFQIGRLTLIAPMLSANGVKERLEQLGQISREVFGEKATIHPTGYVPLYVKIIDYVMEAQTVSFSMAFLLIFIIMLIWLRSLRLAVISLIPNLFPVVIIFGVMGFFGIDLDIATATITAIILGVSIDDTVHFMYHWRKSESQGHSWVESLNHTFKHAGSAAVITTLILLAGYPVLMLGSVKTIVYFGFLTTIAAGAALFADLILLPAILRVWKK